MSMASARLILEAESLQAVHDDLVGQMERLKPQVEAAAEKFERFDRDGAGVGRADEQDLPAC